MHNPLFDLCRAGVRLGSPVFLFILVILPEGGIRRIRDAAICILVQALHDIHVVREISEDSQHLEHLDSEILW